MSLDLEQLCIDPEIHPVLPNIPASLPTLDPCLSNPTQFLSYSLPAKFDIPVATQICT